MDKIILLSDLWGKRNSNWISHYVAALENHFEVIFYDCCELAEIAVVDNSQEKIHQQFMNGGVGRAVSKLLQKEIACNHVLGFSIGGLIAWKAILEGLNVESLTTISSTRLRFEEVRPTCEINLYYAENDLFKPSLDWSLKHDLKMNIVDNESHDFYRNQNTASLVCDEISRRFSKNK